MNALICCEFSGIIRDAYRKRGVEAYSNDLLPTESRYNASFHIQGDCVELLESYPDNTWDIIILHPPCTALAVSGNRWYGEGKERHQERLEAIQWTLSLWELAKRKGKRACLENPVGVLGKIIPATQWIQPYEYGHPESKRTGLWLHNLPPLTPTNIVERKHQRVWLMGETKNRWKDRSRTYQGIADAISEQWQFCPNLPDCAQMRN